MLTDNQCKAIWNKVQNTPGLKLQIDTEEGKQVTAWLKRSTDLRVKKNHDWKSGINN